MANIQIKSEKLTPFGVFFKSWSNLKTRATSEGIPSSINIDFWELNDNPYFTIFLPLMIFTPFCKVLIF